MENQIKTELCPYCHEYNEVYDYCTESVGEQGRIVVQHIVCEICHEEIRERLVDKDI